MSIIRISAGTTNGQMTKAHFGDGGGIEFGYSSRTVTARPFAAKMLEFGRIESANSVALNSGGANLSLQRFTLEHPIAASRIDFLNHYTVAGSTNGSLTMRLALYTMSGSTLGTVATASLGQNHTSGGADATNTGGYSANSGTQWRSIGLGTAAWSLSAGEYFLGVLASQSSPAGTTGSMTLYGKSAVSIANGALLGAANPVNHWAGGIYSAGVSNCPASVHISDVNRTGSYALAQPAFRLLASF
jgi:hypothetical protein